MEKELLLRLVQACTPKCQVVEGGMSGVCGKKAHGIASTSRSSGIQSPATTFLQMCLGLWGWRALGRESGLCSSVEKQANCGGEGGQ